MGSMTLLVHSCLFIGQLYSFRIPGIILAGMCPVKSLHLLIYPMSNVHDDTILILVGMCPVKSLHLPHVYCP
ncbi:hypothetical protein BDA96_01G034000 [Sorghum bicolor]|uniref:Uncharacterized protein n=2 Tax=Sorghum bicolor TaxID=4558 RepID=A0A921UVY1_SORBI|nr:hypothetical protein BDA96_01G034000 [Sorghum bicolor]OQU90712.1 hypothetical protein SORBI_3001G032850 [Sorghum bicolor]